MVLIAGMILHKSSSKSYKIVNNEHSHGMLAKGQNSHYSERDVKSLGCQAYY